MKKIIATLVLLISVICGAMAQNDAMYVYRNDGIINAFLKADVDSMRYSQLDLDSVLHSEYVVQEVWAVDSVYRIPLEKIDSVSFVTPPTVYKSGVINISDDLIDYVIGREDYVLKLKANTPSAIIPQAGEKLVLLKGCEALPNGFAGKVVAVNVLAESINVVCEQTFIEDIFDSFCSVQTVCGYADDPAEANAKQGNAGQKRAVYNPDDRTFKLGPYTVTASGELSQGITQNGDLALKGGASLSVTLEPTFRIHTFLIIGEGHGVYFSSSITGNLVVTSSSSIYGGLEWEHEFLNPVINFPIPYTADLVNYYINPGLFFRANAMITSTLSTTRNYSFGMAFDFSSIGESVVKPSLGGRLVSSNTEMTGSIDGSAALGAYIETGFNLVSRELSRVCVRGEYGVQFNGNFVLRNSDIDNASKETGLYERLKASSVEYGPFVSASLVASVLNSSSSPSLQVSRTEEKWDLVPTFKNTKLKHTPNSSASLDAYTELSGNCLFPVPVGYKLFDVNNREIADYEATSSYTNVESKFEHTFNGMSQNAKYVVYPKVKVFGYEMLASPSAELNTVTPKITNFKQTSADYFEGAYYNDGRYYDYEFRVATTVEIESLEGIADWGYVYKDPYGNVKRISLMGYGTSYTDTRYAYYRNEAKSTVCLYGYVKYEGDDEYYYGEPHDYPLEYAVHTCPDNNHPHAIDLGLPSGTKWCCMNVGASSPEQYGGYYAWGETSEKSVYNEVTYSYYNGEDTNGDGWIDTNFSLVNIGSDIAGTSYDVAHVRMGGSWRMPSLAQQQELINNCTLTFTQQNGVYGVLVTGKNNGGQHFLPAAGNRGSGGLVSAGSSGSYWSSSLSPRYDYCADGLGFDSGYWYWGRSNRNFGFSVRAVCP